MSPKVSINLCCYNSEKYLRETLDSIVNQTFKDWELVIVNDGSTDSTESIIQEYQLKKYPIVYYYQSNSGLSKSRNKALELSKGIYIAFIDHDDLWMPEKLEKQVQKMVSNSRYGLVHTNWESFNDNKYIVTMFQQQQPEGMIFRNQLYDYNLGLPSVMIRANVLSDLDHFFELSLTICEEVDFFLRICSKWEVGYIHDILARYRMHSDSLTSKKRELFGIELEYIANKLKLFLNDQYSVFQKDIRQLFARAAYEKAYFQMSKGNYGIARTLLLPHLFVLPKLVLVYFATFIPFKYYQIILKLFRRKVHISS